MATAASATNAERTNGATGPRRARAFRAATWLRRLRLFGSLILLVATAGPAIAASNKVRISNLSDVAFGTIANLGTDASVSQDLCLYSGTSTAGYNITASGTGPGGTFLLSSASGLLQYEVQWNSSAAQSVGTQLTANVPLAGQTSAATQQACNSGPSASASLIVILRSAALSSASAGDYTGTLTLLVGPE